MNNINQHSKTDRNDKKKAAQTESRGRKMQRRGHCANTKASSLGGKRSRSESSEATNEQAGSSIGCLDVVEIRRMARLFTSIKSWQTIPEIVRGLQPMEGDARKEFATCLDKLEKQIHGATRCLSSADVYDTYFPILVSLLENVLSCVSAEKRGSPALAIKLFGRNPSKSTIRLHLLSLRTFEGWQDVIGGLASLEPTPGNAPAFRLLDELGGVRHILSSFLRLASSESFTNTIKVTFGVSSVCFIAAGTGCQDVIYPAGSRPESYDTVFTGSCDGRAIWRKLAEVKCSVQPSLAPYIFTLASGLEFRPATPVLKSVEQHPDGYVSAATGHALVGNARAAALLLSELKGGVLQALCPTVMPTSDPALIEFCLPFIRGLHYQAIHRFIKLNALAGFKCNRDRMQLVAKALALVLSCTDADIPQDLFVELCTTKGVLTSHTVEIRGSTSPQGARTVGNLESGLLVVPDGGRRYRVTEAMVAMYLTCFGAVRRPARTGEAFELVVLEYLMVAIGPASIVAEWSRSDALKVLSLASPDIARFGLFDLLVDAFADAGVAVGGMFSFRLPSKFEPGRKNNNGKKSGEADNGIWTLEDVWRMVEPHASAQPEKKLATVAVVVNADKASGADLMVLCHGHFAMHIQVKTSQQTSTMPRADVERELAKMGALHGPVLVKEKGHAERCARASQCIKASQQTFPKQYFAIVRCVAPGVDGAANGAGDFPAHEGCRYIQVTAGHNGAVSGDPFYPLVTVPSTQTADALCFPRYYPLGGSDHQQE